MKPTVYVETSIVGYLAMRGSNLLLVASNQQLTRDWWDNRRSEYELFASRFVVNECSAGDPAAAQERIAYLRDIPLAQVTVEVDRLAMALMNGVPLPKKAEVDAFHIATAAGNGIQYLLTWNCTHIANAVLQLPIERICRAHGYEPPVICTPQELMRLKDGT